MGVVNYLSLIIPRPTRRAESGDIVIVMASCLTVSLPSRDITLDPITAAIATYRTVMPSCPIVIVPSPNRIAVTLDGGFEVMTS